MTIARSLFQLLRLSAMDRTHLALENLALRQQLAVFKRSTPRPKLRTRDRLFWVLLRRMWSGWQDALVLVRPRTLLGWHRQGWRLLWHIRSKAKPGRPPIPNEVRELIRRLSLENRLWGSPRIKDELEHLGHSVALSTIDKYRARWTGPPSPTWRTFLHNHAGEILACDFFTIPTASFRSVTGFVVMEINRRRILACDVTRHPTATWAAEVVRRAFLVGGGRGQHLIRDRDSIYGAVFSHAMRDLGLRQVVTAYHAPRMNAFCERLIGTLRRECLDHMIVMGEGHARRLLDEYADYYNTGRCHQALGGESPVTRGQGSARDGQVVGVSVLGGLHHTCRRVA